MKRIHPLQKIFYGYLVLFTASVLCLTPNARAGQNESLPVIQIGSFAKNSLEGWEEKKFVGQTSYKLQKEGDQTILHAEADTAASGLFKEVEIDLTTYPYLNWSWKAKKTHPPLLERTKAGDDYVARIYIVVKGGLAFWKTRAINYVWSSAEKKGAIWPNAFAGKNVMLMAIRSAEDNKGIWYQEKRNVYEDLRNIFGKEINTINAVAIMTDSDNAGGSVSASYGDISFSTE